MQLGDGESHEGIIGFGGVELQVALERLLKLSRPSLYFRSPLGKKSTAVNWCFSLVIAYLSFLSGGGLLLSQKGKGTLALLRSSVCPVASLPG
jgi:hypothetical protein